MTPDSPLPKMEESKRLLRALPLRLTLGIIEALADGGAVALTRVSKLSHQVSAAMDKELRASTRQDRFKRSVVKDIEAL